MEVTDEMVDRLAELARLEFSADEKVQVVSDLGKMIRFVDKLNELDTTGVEPVLHMSSETNAMRDDVLAGSISREEALRNAPDKNDQFFRVPKVINR